MHCKEKKKQPTKSTLSTHANISSNLDRLDREKTTNRQFCVCIFYNLYHILAFRRTSGYFQFCRYITSGSKIR